VQVPTGERQQWEHFLQQLPFPSWEETHNPAYQLFLA